MPLRTAILIGLAHALMIATFARAVAEEASYVPSPPIEENAPQVAPRFAKRPVPIEGEFREGWKQTVALPETEFGAGGQVTLTVEQGWLCIRQESSGGQLEWQVVLCQIADGVLPLVEIMDSMPFFVGISYRDGRYFVRDGQGVFRAVREAAPGGALLAKAVLLSKKSIARGFGGSPPWMGIVCTSWEDDDWYFVASGPASDRESWRAIVRLNPMKGSGQGFGVSTTVAGHIHHFHGDKWLIDDGELLVATRTPIAIYEAKQKQEKARDDILAGNLPAIDATAWLNTDDAPTWDTLKGKVVLVDFWGTWCGPCVAKLPDTQKLHENYAERGLAVIGIHSVQSADSCAALLEEEGYTFPVALDSGKTADAFVISSWPTYFLIDRAGKVVEGFTHAPPSTAAIEAQLESAEQ